MCYIIKSYYAKVLTWVENRYYIQHHEISNSDNKILNNSYQYFFIFIHLYFGIYNTRAFRKIEVKMCGKELEFNPNLCINLGLFYKHIFMQIQSAFWVGLVMLYYYVSVIWGNFNNISLFVICGVFVYK